MRVRLGFALAFSSLFYIPALTAAPLAPPDSLYKELANTIDTASGNMMLTFQGGQWKTQLNGRTVLWNLSDPTKVQVTASYQMGGLAPIPNYPVDPGQQAPSAVVVFSPAIHVWLLPKSGSPGLSTKITKIAFDPSGSIISWDATPDNQHGSLSAADSPALQRHFEFAQDPKNLFSGLPFASSSATSFCTGTEINTCNTPRPMLLRLQIYPQFGLTGLTLKLKNNSTIFFSKASPTSPSALSNFLTVLSPTQLVLTLLDWDVQQGTLTGTLDNFQATVSNGQIATGGTTLQLANGTTVDFSQIAFSRDTTSALVDASNGAINGTLGPNTLIALSSGGTNASQLSIESANIKLVGVVLNTSSSGSYTLTVSNGSAVDAAVDPSRLSFGSQGVLGIHDGRVNLAFSGSWSSGTGPNLSGSIQNLDVNLTSGVFDLNQTSRINLIAGHVVGGPGTLQFNSLQSPVVTGSFQEVSFTFDDHTHFEVPGGISMDVKPGATFIAKDINAPFTILPSRLTPFGNFQLVLPFYSFKNANIASFELTNGNFAGNLSHPLDGSVKGSNLSVSGTLGITTDSSQLTAQTTITQGSLSILSAGQTPTFDGLISLTIPANAYMSFVTQGGVGDTGSASRIFPINLQVGFASPFSIANVPLHFAGSQVKASFTAPATFSVKVPPGGGEYNDRDNLGAGFKTGNNLDGLQEIYIDDFHNPTSCTKNVSLKVNTYTIPTTLTVDLEGKSLSVSMANSQFPHIDWDDDGCSTLPLAIFSFVVAGPAGPIAVHSLDDYIVDKADRVMQDAVQNKVASGWHITI